MKYLLRTISVFCVGILLLCAGIASAQDLTIGNYSLVSKTRVSRTEYNYTYQADITNTGSDVQNVTATLTSNSSHTIVVAGTLSFGDVASGATVTSSDTFTIKQNRRYPLNWSDLVWDIQHESEIQPLRIKDVIPSAALPGDTISIAVSGKIDGVPLQAILSGQLIDTTPLAGCTDCVTFEVPDGAKSSPLYLEQDDRSSNSVWFSVTVSVVTPAPEDIVTDDSGTKIAVNLVVVSMKEGFDNPIEAQRVADLGQGVVVGQVPLIAGYQVRVSTKTLSELEAVVEIFEADPVVDFVLIDTAIIDEAANWNDDPDWLSQRSTNKVEEGAALYTQEVSPADSTKIHPLFTSIGILEKGVDFDAADFDNYAAKGLARSNNIAIYSKDIEGGDTETKHGSTVGGIVAAELGDGDEKTGGNAGLLQGLQSNHGGFNISVKTGSGEGEKWASGVLKNTEEILEDGATVINWSLGYVKEGTTRADGQPVHTLNVVSEKIFNNTKKAFEKGIKKIESDYPKAVIVAAAGNDNASVTSVVPAGIDSDSMMVVGAHNAVFPSDRTGYSHYGSMVDISACGDVMKSHSQMGSGTSFAAPLVTATIATMLSINPDLSPKEIRHLLRKSALPVHPDVQDNNGNVIDVFTKKLSKGDGEVRDDGKCFSDDSLDCDGKSTRLNVEGAIQAAIDSLEGKTVPKGDLVEVELKFCEGDVTKSVEVTVPSGDVFDKVDILFLVDVSGSYGDDITQFKNKAVDLVDVFHTAGKNVQTGVATFSDFPISPYGSSSSGDYAYMLNQPLTADSAAAIAAINEISLHFGADGPESQLEALYQAATGAGRTVAGHPEADIAPSSVGWRSGSFPIIFLATDASFHNSNSEPSYPGAGRTQTLSELASRGIRIYGLQSGGSMSDVVSIVADTGGESFTLSRNSSEIVDAVIAALEGASSSVDIRLVPNGDFAELIQSITPEDGYQDITPGETRTFDVTFSRHFWKRDPTADHIFSLRLEVVAEGVAVIMEIPVTVHVKFR